MGKSTPSYPATPDPVATAQAQSAADKETAIAQAALNRISQETPYGTVSYKQTGYDESAGVPLYTQTTSFSPEQQALFDVNQSFNLKAGQIAQEQLGRLQSALSEPISYENAPALMSAGDEATVSKAQEAIMSRLAPQQAREREALEARLASQGIALGSQPYETAMQQYQQGVTDANTQAALNAYSLANQQAQQQNLARQQAIQEAASIRNQPLNEISALISGTQVQSPSFSGVSQVSLPQSTLGQNIYSSYVADQNAYQQKLANQQSALGGLFGLGSTALSFFSDKRLKRDIVKVGTLKGFNLYRFKYLWDDVLHLGFIAQEVEQKRPDAVFEVCGFKAINYGVL